MEHLYITEQEGIYFLNSENGYKFFDKTAPKEERGYWVKRSLLSKSEAENYEAITEEEVERLEEEREKAVKGQTGL